LQINVRLYAAELKSVFFLKTFPTGQMSAMSVKTRVDGWA